MHQQVIHGARERCEAFGLVPQHSPDLSLLDTAALHGLHQRNERLCAQALPVMEMLYEQLIHAQSVVLLTDASGLVLHALGDDGFLTRAQQVALAPGALWSESSKGTNAVGTALMTEAPTLVHGQEHYLRATQFLTCSAAPIFDHKGALLGVIDVSGERRSYHPHTLALASMSARLIESQWFADRFRHSTRLHFHTNVKGLGTLHEGQLALDEDGRVLGVNRRAMELLGMPAMSLRRESLLSLFGCTLGSLAELSRASGEQPLHLASAGAAASALHAKLSLAQQGLSLQRAQARQELHLIDDEQHQPVEAAEAGPSVLEPVLTTVLSGAAPRASAGLRAPSLREMELQAIAAAVQAASGNLSEAARTLGIGRSTLYRKLRQGAQEPLHGDPAQP